MFINFNKMSKKSQLRQTSQDSGDELKEALKRSKTNFTNEDGPINKDVKAFTDILMKSGGKQTLIAVEANGSCLFGAVLTSKIRSSPPAKDVDNLRKRVCQYLKLH